MRGKVGEEQKDIVRIRQRDKGEERIASFVRGEYERNSRP